MKTVKLLLFGLCLLAFIGCNQEKWQLSIKTKIYCDHCEKCESCKERVVNALTALAGVIAADMNVKEETILVNFDTEKIDAQRIKEAIAQTGFDADDVKADPAAYENLDGCCKKK